MYPSIRVLMACTLSVAMSGSYSLTAPQSIKVLTYRDVKIHVEYNGIRANRLGKIIWSNTAFQQYTPNTAALYGNLLSVSVFTDGAYLAGSTILLSAFDGKKVFSAPGPIFLKDGSKFYFSNIDPYWDAMYLVRPFYPIAVLEFDTDTKKSRQFSVPTDIVPDDCKGDGNSRPQFESLRFESKLKNLWSYSYNSSKCAVRVRFNDRTLKLRLVSLQRLPKK